MLDFQKLSADYQQTLLRQIVPFWLKHGCDNLCGGYFDAISATGKAIDSDKYVVLQAQQVWAFAWLYNTVDAHSAWLDHALHGATFLSRFAHTTDLTNYAQLNRRGQPITPATDDNADASVVAAYAQLHRATGDDEWATLAKAVFRTLCQRRRNALAQQIQSAGGFWQLRHMSEPITILRAALDMQPLLDEEAYKETIDWISDEILHQFLDKRTDTLREYIVGEGAFVNTPEGRRLNVGLIFRAITYLLSLSSESGNRKLAMQVVTWALRLCELAWDETTGGLQQYVDQKNQPPTFPDWQQKWAWIQLEAITALMKGYFQTRHPDCPKWFKRIHEYTFSHFSDAKHGGWHVVVDQYHQPILSAKATPAVGCFSLIHCLAETAQTLAKCGQLQPLGRHVRVN